MKNFGKRLLSFALALIMVLSMVPFNYLGVYAAGEETHAASIGTVGYETLDAAFAAATEGQTITLLADAAPALTSQRKITKAAVIDLNGKTLTLTEDDLYFGTTTFQNGTIVVAPSVKPSTAVFWMFENQTLIFEDVEIVATGVTGTYLIGINGCTGTAVALIDSKITIDNETKATLSAVICDNGTGNSVVIENSEIKVDNLNGRFYMGGNDGTITVKDSDIDLNGVKEGFYLRDGQTMSVEGDSVVDIVLNDTNGRYGINFNGEVTYTKADTATVNGTDNKPEPVYAAKINGVGYASLADALAAAKTMTGDVVVEIYDKVTLDTALSGSFDSIQFVGMDTDAEIYLDVQGYITATGKKVAFEKLILSKAAGGYIANAGFMNVAFGIFDVAEVTYTDCTFANGAYATSGKVTFTGCTFKRSHDKYGLWAYGDAEILVDGCTFADYRGIKVYAEGMAKAADLTVKNTDFSAVDNKPAIVLTSGEKVTLEKNTYSATGVFELDLDGVPNGTPVSTDDVAGLVCKNDKGACGVLVDGKIYTTVAQAAAAATEGDTVILLHDSAETVELPDGVTLNRNGHTAAGITLAGPKGTVTPAYTGEVDGYVRIWGEGGGNAKESYVLKLYAGDKLIATSQLNNIGGIINGNVYVTWNFYYPASNDEYWTTTWEAGQPNSLDQPTKVELYLDGVKVAENVAKMSGADDLNPVVWENLGGVQSITKVSTKAELDAALSAAEEGDTIVLTADIDYGTTQLSIHKAITLDLGGKTLTTRNAWGGMSVKNNPTIKNGTIVHASNTAAIKVWNATAFEDLVIDVQGKGDANKTIGGIVLQSGTTTKVGSIKNVTIKGDALTNGIETYNCGDAAENVIGSMENVTIDANGTGLLISAPCGTATNCSISGDVNAIEIWIKGTYSASLDLVDCDVEGSVYAHDEISSNPDIVNNGELSLTVDSATTGVNTDNITLVIARAENVGGVLKATMENAVAKIGGTYYASLKAAIAAAQDGDTVVILPGEYGAFNISNKNITIKGTVGDNGELLTTIKGGNPAITGHNFNGTIADLKIVDAWKIMYAEPAGNVTVDNVYVTGATYGFHLVAYSPNLTWTIKNSYMDLAWANSFGVYGDGDAAIIIKGNRFEATNPYYPDYGALAVNTFLPNVTVEENIFGQNAKIYVDASVTDTSNINISRNYHADGVENAFADDADGVVVGIPQYYESVDANGNLTNLVTCAAKIGNIYYATLQAAFAAAKEGDTVIILAGDYTADIAVKSGITVEGQTDAEGNNLVNITGRVSVSSNGTVKNLNVNNDKTGDYDCALVVNGNNILLDGVKLTGYNAMRYCYADGNITVKNSTVNGRNFTVHFDGSAGGNIAFENCDITGWCSYASTFGSVSYTNCSINQGNTAGHRYYNKNISFTNCEFAEGMKIDLRASDSNVTINDADMTAEEAKALFKDPYYVVKGNVTLNNEKLTYVASAYTANGSKYFDSLQAAIDEVINNGYITVRSDIVLTAPVTVPAGKRVEIGLGAYNLTCTSNVMDEAMIINNGELTISGSGNTSGNIKLTSQTATVTAPAGLNVISAVDGYKVVCEDGTYKLVKINYVAEVDGVQYESLQAAIDAADGKTVKILKDIELTEGVVIDAGKTVTLDLNGKTVTGKPVQAKAFSVITNKGSLTVTGNGAVVCDHQLAGSTGYAVNTITNAGMLVIDGAVIENKSTAAGQIGYAIDNNSTTGNAVVQIKNGEVKASGSNYYDGIRLFCNSQSNENAVTVTGGAVSSIWMQNPSDGDVKDMKDVKGSVAISGGAVNALYLEPSAAFEAAISGGYVGNVSYFTTAEGRDLTGFVTGGTFGAPVADAFCADGYSPVDNGDGTYGVKVDLPQVEITDVKNTLDGEDPDLTFALNFAIANIDNLTDAYLNELFETYGEHYVDYVLTISGLNGDSVTFNANGNADGYLAGQYDAWSENWVTVPFEDVTVNDGQSLYIMEYAAKLMGKSGLRFTLAEVAAIVQNFDCGVYFTPEFLAEHPDLEITLQLKVFTEDAEGNKIENIDVATNEFKNNYAAIVTGEDKQTRYFTTFADAYAAAQAGDTIQLLRDVTLNGKLTVGKSVTIDGNGFSIIANHTAFILETSTDCTFKDVTLNTNNKAKGVKIASGNVVFDNVTIPNSNKSDAITVYGTLLLKNYFKVATTYTLIDARSGAVTAEPGTVFDIANWRANVSPATSDLTGAVDTEGNPFFEAYGSTTYYMSLDSIATSLSNITLLDNVALTKDKTISGTLNLNGHDLTVADGKALKVSGKLTVTGEGNINGDIKLTSQTATVTAPAGLNVVSGVEGYKVVYADGTYSLVVDNDVAYIIVGGVKEYYESVQDAVDDAIDKGTDDNTVYLCKDAEEMRLTVDEGIVLDLNGYTLTVTRNVTGYGEIKGEGVLVAPKDKVKLYAQSTNAVPLWNGNGYVFAAIIRFNTPVSGGKFWLQPIFDEKGTELLKNGVAEAGITIRVAITWENAEGRTFTNYTDISDKNATKIYTTDYKGGVNITVLDADVLNNLRYHVQVVSTAGTVIESTPMNHIQ